MYLALFQKGVKMVWMMNMLYYTTMKTSVCWISNASKYQYERYLTVQSKCTHHVDCYLFCKIIKETHLHANWNTLRSLNCTVKPMWLINKCILQLQNNFHIKLHKMKGYIKPITGLSYFNLGLSGNNSSLCKINSQ